MSTTKQEESAAAPAKWGQLQFEYLPAYAKFLLEHKTKEFAAAMLNRSREEQVPLLRYFESMPEEQLIALTEQGARDLLDHFARNQVRAFIDQSLKSWKENQLPLIRYDEIVVEDITKVSFVRRQVFRDFLPLYSSDIQDFINIMEEVDRFTVAQEETSYQTLFELKQQRINEHHYFIEKINNTSPGIIYVFDLLEHQEIYSNHKREDLLGYTEADMKTMGPDVLPQIIHPDDLPRAYQHIQDFATAPDGDMRTIEYRVRNKQGIYAWLRAFETVFKRTEAGDPSQIIGIAIDISQEKEASLQLEHSEQQLLEAQEIAGMGSFEWNLSGNNSVFSPQLFKIFDMEGSSNLMAFLEHVHPSDRQKVKGAIEKAIHGDGIYECEYRYQKNATEKVIWSRGLVVFQDGKPVKMKGTVMDVTQRHDMLKRLERSEELHKQAQALTHIGNWSWFITDDTISWSDEMYRIYGLEPQSEAITFNRFLSLVHPDDRQKRQEEIRRALETHRAEDYIMRIIAADGTQKILQGKGEVLVDENDQPYKLVGTCQDVTRQYLLNEQLKQSEETFRQLIFNAPDAVIVIDEDSQIVLWNPKAEAIFGWTADEAIGKTLMETVIPPMFHAGHLAGINRLHETGESRVLNKTIELIGRKKSGEEFYIALSIARSGSAGNPVFISFIRDISREKDAEQELEKRRNELTQKNIELERSNQELIAFNYIASHDLQEPVRKIQIFSDRILDKNGAGLPDEARDFLERIAASADHMQKLIDALLAFFRATSMEKVFKPVDLNGLLQQVKTALQDDIREKKAVITAFDLPVLDVIPFQFHQLLENLLCNALKYSRPNTPPEIRITTATLPGAQLLGEGARPDHSYQQISIADNGIGFDQQYVPKIFELFQRLHGKNEYAGTGIGLAICKKIAENHGGFITAQGREGEGATFHVYVPLNPKRSG